MNSHEVEKSSTFYVIVLIITLMLCGCKTVDTPHPTPTPTKEPTETVTTTSTPIPEPTVTNTTEPTYTLSGTIFFDYNGSGLQDSAYNLDGEAVEEPGIPDVTVCLDHDPYELGVDDKNCVYSDAEGDYQFSDIEDGSHVVYVVSPSDEPAEAFRYINVWKRTVVIEEYSKDVDAGTMLTLEVIQSCEENSEAKVCKFDDDTLLVREQHLNDTKVKTIDKALDIRLTGDKEINIALMQGFLTLPYSSADAPFYWISNYVDLNPEIGKILLFNNMTNMYWSRPEGEENTGGSGDQHNGIDFEGPENTHILAAFSGTVYETMGTQTPIILIGNMKSLPFKISNGHHNGLLVEAGKVYRGQIIGFNGIGAYGVHPHNHFGLYVLRNNFDAGIGPDDLRIDPFGVLWSDESNTITYPDRENESVKYGPYSAWTTYNLPIFP